MTATNLGAAAAEADGLLAELFLTPEGRRDPYPRYARIREVAPVHRSALGFWVLSRYDDCQFVLRDPRFGKGSRDDASRLELMGATFDEAAVAALKEIRTAAPPMLMLDPPDHTRLRGLVSKAFTPRTVERLRPHIGRLLDDVLDGLDGDTTDVMQTIAFPLPVTVIGELLGIPPADRAGFQPLVRASTALLEMTVSSAELVAAAAARREMNGYFHDLLAERRRAPGDDLLSDLLAVEDGGDTLSEAELITTAILLFAAGFETTTNLIGNGLLALLRSPGEFDRLRASPGMARGAVEELLRYDSPVQIDGRLLFEDVEIDGHAIEAGSFVVTLLGGCNRDPSHFADPDRLDLGRDDGPPLSFGSGIHYCLGAALARVEGQVVFERLGERFPHMELATDAVDYRPSLTLRGLSSLPVALQG